MPEDKNDENGKIDFDALDDHWGDDYTKTYGHFFDKKEVVKTEYP